MLELKMLPYPLKVRIIQTTENVHNPYINTKLKHIPRYSQKCPEGTPHPVSSLKGKIEVLVVKLPKNSEGLKEYNILSIFAEIAKKIETLKTIIIIYHGQEFSETNHLYTLLEDINITVIPLKVAHGNLTSWIQDIFYPVLFKNSIHAIEKDKLCWVIGKKYSRDEKVILTKLLEQNQSALNINNLDNVVARASPVTFEGGDILIDDVLVLAGKDSKSKVDFYKKWLGVHPIYVGIDNTVKWNKYQLFPNDGVMSDGFYHTFQKGIFGEKQPLFHIDLFITLAGLNEKKEYIIMVGEPMLDFQFSKKAPNDVFSFLYHWVNDFKVIINNSIQHLKKTQHGHPIKIVRNPLVLTYEDDILDANGNIYKTPTRKWFWTSYNNCLVQVVGDDKKVWLPSYGGKYSNYAEQEKLLDPIKNKIASSMNLSFDKINYGNWSELEVYDLWNKRIWESLGFTACLLSNNYIPIALDNASLKCMTNCIKRIIN